MTTRSMARRARVLSLGTVVGITLLIAAASTSASLERHPTTLAWHETLTPLAGPAPAGAPADHQRDSLQA